MPIQVLDNSRAARKRQKDIDEGNGPKVKVASRVSKEVIAQRSADANSVREVTRARKAEKAAAKAALVAASAKREKERPKGGNLDTLLNSDGAKKKKKKGFGANTKKKKKKKPK